MTWLWIFGIWFVLLAAWLAYVLWDDARATLENLRKRNAEWHRTPQQGPWGRHIHSADIDRDTKDES